MTFQSMTGFRAAISTRETGPYGWLTPFIGDIANQHPEFASRILCLSRAEVHFLGIAYVAMTLCPDARARRDGFVRAYTKMKRRTLLLRFAFVGNPARATMILKLSRKFGGDLWRPASYIRALTFSKCPNTVKTLRHSPTITRRTLLDLQALPQVYRTAGVLSHMARNRHRHEVVFALAAVERIRPDLTPAQIVVSLKSAKPGALSCWVRRHLQRARFPAPPTGRLCDDQGHAVSPLESYQALANAAREFDNCLRTYQGQVLRGQRYFYRYTAENNGKGVGIIELRQMPVVGWVIEEALGPNNNDLSGQDRLAIINLFAKADIIATPQMRQPGRWFDID
ncbi:MAG: hypothetical protein AAGH42_11500 [Pseudomonadota bacterium]